MENTSQNIARAYDALETAHRALRDELKALRARGATDREIVLTRNALDAAGGTLDMVSSLSL